MRGRFALVSVALLGAIGLLAYSNATRNSTESSTDEPSLAENGISAAITPSDTVDDPGNRGEIAEVPHAEPKAEVASGEVERWIADSLSEDHAQRSAAIIALRQAPKDRAVPALREVIDAGWGESDRQLALRSLHTLAIEQGDEDGSIRDVLRYAAYHGDDDGVSESAQGYLEDLDVALGHPSPHSLPEK